MKKNNISEDTLEKSKVTIKDIKRNPETDVLHTIKLVKAQERKIVFLLAGVILLILCIGSYFIFTNIGSYEGNQKKIGPLVVEYSNDIDGMSDVVSFIVEDENTASFSSSQFTISNDSGQNSWYAVYLNDYIDMIEYDKCFDKTLDKNQIYFSIDDSEKISLASVFKDGKYIITQGIVPSNGQIKHSLQVWYNGKTIGHYHGKIEVEYIR